jgi:hypothetical protein
LAGPKQNPRNRDETIAAADEAILGLRRKKRETIAAYGLVKRPRIGFTIRAPRNQGASDGNSIFDNDIFDVQPLQISDRNRAHAGHADDGLAGLYA